MNERRSAEAETRSVGPPDASASLRPSATKSGVVRIARAERPSWERVDEYFRSGKHREHVEDYARRDPAFADVLRWMRHDREEDLADPETEPGDPPPSSNLRHLPGCQTSGVDRPECS